MSRLPKPDTQIVILASPALERFVIPVDRFVIAAMNADVAAEQFGFRGVADEFVESGLAIHAGQLLQFGLGGVLQKVARSNCGDVEMTGRLFIEQDAVAGKHNALASLSQVVLKMVWRYETVAIEKQQVRRRTGANTFVSATGQLIGLMRVCCQLDAEWHRCGEFPNKIVCFVFRAVIRDDHLEHALDVSLSGDGMQRPNQVPRTFKAGNEYRNSGGALHSI